MIKPLIMNSSNCLIMSSTHVQYLFSTHENIFFRGKIVVAYVSWFLAEYSLKFKSLNFSVSYETKGL
jgi:hypothetical protein